MKRFFFNFLLWVGVDRATPQLGGGRTALAAAGLVALVALPSGRQVARMRRRGRPAAALGGPSETLPDLRTHQPGPRPALPPRAFLPVHLPHRGPHLFSSCWSWEIHWRTKENDDLSLWMKWAQTSLSCSVMSVWVLHSYGPSFFTFNVGSSPDRPNPNYFHPNSWPSPSFVCFLPSFT